MLSGAKKRRHAAVLHELKLARIRQRRELLERILAQRERAEHDRRCQRIKEMAEEAARRPQLVMPE